MQREEKIPPVHPQYIGEFRPQPEGGYSVRCPAFPGLITSGQDLEEARAMAREALELCVEVFHKRGWPLPPPDAEPKKIIKEPIPVKLARA